MDIKKQSEAAYKQWAEQWRKHAKYHSKHEMKSLSHFQDTGIGKAALLIANGYSFEENIETIREYQDNVDVMCVDKTLIHCINNGIIPKFCIVCDANISYEKYLKPIEDKLQDTILIANVCANPEWTDNGNWKDMYFFTNRDVLGSEKEFKDLSGCPNILVAGTNVSNALLVFVTQSDERGKINFFSYDKILLIGYDYSWTDKSYYAFDRTGGGKANYMKMAYIPSAGGKIVYTSNNLLFSCKWADQYIKAYNHEVYQCSKLSILNGKKVCDLKQQIQYGYKQEDAVLVIRAKAERRRAQAKIDEMNKLIFNIGRDHFKQVIRTT